MALLVLVLAGVGWSWMGRPSQPPRLAQPSPTPSPAPAQGTDCTGCHALEAEAWMRSNHARAMQAATPATVLGDFKDTAFAQGQTRALFKQGPDGYSVTTTDLEGKERTYPVRYTFGVEPLQQYLLELPGGRRQAFTVAWDVARAQWFDLGAGSGANPPDALHWMDRRYTWNSSCADCHSTGITVGYDPKQKQYNTQWLELSVGCRACHTMNATHGQMPERQSETTQANGRQPVEGCAPCHARRYPITDQFKADAPLLDRYVPELLDEQLYFPDGQIKDEVFEYGSFVQSRMYQQGVVCTDCHDPHSGSTKAPGNALCTRCHESTLDGGPDAADIGAKTSRQSRFKTLKPGTYDSPAHHHHPAGTQAALCTSCHMPSRVYMQLDVRHDHSMRIPRPDLSESLGTPNACISCHTERSNLWAEQWMTRWYGDTWKRPQFGEALEAGRRGAPDADLKLAALVSDQSQPEIARATALTLLSGQSPTHETILQTALADASPLLKRTAAEAMQPLPPERKAGLLESALSHPLRAVRIAAAASLADASPDSLTPSGKLALEAGLREYTSAQQVVDDQPEGQANLGNLFARMGKTVEAEAAYRAALDRDPSFYPAYQNLGMLLYQSGRTQEAADMLQRGLTFAPAQPMLHYTLGLLLAEQNQLDAARRELSVAATLAPDSAGILLDLGLLLARQGKREEAARIIQKAALLAPDAPRVKQALQDITGSEPQAIPMIGVP